MIKAITAIVAILCAAQVSAIKCPRSKEIGNFNTYLHLFKEQADTHLSFYNTQTDLRLVFEVKVGGVPTDTPPTLSEYKAIFRLVDSRENKTWFYLVWVKFNAGGQIISEIYKSGRFRDYRDAVLPGTITLLNTIIFSNFMEEAVDLTLDLIPCCDSLIKLEWDYFYYMLPNFYKSGKGINTPLCTTPKPPVLPMAKKPKNK
jgi:hypothetical protein